MKPSTTATARAIEDSARRFVPRVLLDGVDISAAVDAIRGTRSLSGGLPDDVAVIEGVGAARLELELSGMGGLSAAATWSRTTAVGPWANRERLGRVVTVDVGVRPRLPTALPEFFRIFTGYAWSVTVTPVGTARLVALDARDRTRDVWAYPPVINGSAGLRPFWLLSYAAHRSGFETHPSPVRWHPQDPAAGWWTVFYAPFCGSGAAFIAGVNAHANIAFTRHTTDGASGGGWLNTPDPIGAPAPACVYRSATDAWSLTGTAPTFIPPGVVPGVARSVRVEAWVKPPADLTGYPTPVALFGTDTSGGGQCALTFSASGSLGLRTGGVSFSGPNVVNDPEWIAGGWNHIGVHATVPATGPGIEYTYYLNGKRFDRSSTQTVTLGDAGKAVVNSFVPIANAAVSRAPASAPWLDWRTHNPTARLSVSPGQTHVWVGETRARSTWEHLSAVADSLMARVYFDTAGVLRVVQAPTAGTTARTLTTSRAITALSIEDSLDRVRNIVSTTAHTGSAIYQQNPWTYSGDPIEIPARGTVHIEATWSGPLLYETPTAFTVRATDPGGETSWIYLDYAPLPSGSGTPVSPALVSARLVAVTGASATIAVTTTATRTAWITAPPAGNVPAIGIRGKVINPGTYAVVVTDAASVAEFGPYAYPDPANPWLQTGEADDRATAILASSARPAAVITGADIVGDPRLEIGDVVALVDPHGTAANGRWFVVGIADTYSTRDGYAQRLDLRAAPN